MGERDGRGGLLHADGGRLRLGWRLLLFLVVTVLAAALLAWVLPGGLWYGSVALLVGSLIGGAALLHLDGRSPAALGFYADRTALGEAAAGVALGVAVGWTALGAIALAGGLTWRADGGTAGGWLLGAGTALAWLAVPAAAEEAFLRGYPLQALAESWGPGAALWATAAVFAAMHLPNPGVSGLALVNIAVAGLFLGVVYLRTASLWWASGVHLGWNWSHGWVGDVPVSGLEVFDAPLYESVARGPAWLGGGDFGPEGSALTTAVVLAAAAGCWWGPWLRPGRAALEAGPLAWAGGTARA